MFLEEKLAALEFRLASLEKAVNCQPPARGDLVGPPALLEATAEVASAFSFKPVLFKSALRTEDLVFARHLAMYIGREVLGLSLGAVARTFERDHGTVSHAVKHIRAYLEIYQHDRNYATVMGLIARFSQPNNERKEHGEHVS